jgi:hypothetical protein
LAEQQHYYYYYCYHRGGGGREKPPGRMMEKGPGPLEAWDGIPPPVTTPAACNHPYNLL